MLIDRYMILQFFTYPTCPTSSMQNCHDTPNCVMITHTHMLFIFLYISNNVKIFNMYNLTDTNNFLERQENAYRKKNETMLQNHERVRCHIVLNSLLNTENDEIITSIHAYNIQIKYLCSRLQIYTTAHEQSRRFKSA